MTRSWPPGRHSSRQRPEALSWVALRQVAPAAPQPRPPRRLWQPIAALTALLVAILVAVLASPLGSAVRRSVAEPPAPRTPAPSPTTPTSNAVPPGAAQPASGAGAGPASGPIAPGSFAPGACVAYPPTGPDRHRTVFLDPGHGGPDPGAVGITQDGHAVDEASITLATARATLPVLLAGGYRVVLSRTTNSPVAVPGPGDLTSGVYTAAGALRDWTARAACADRAQADALIGIHFNAGSTPSDAGLLAVYDNVRPFSSRSLRLATLLHDDLLGSLNAKGWGIPDDGVVDDASAGAPGLDQADRTYGRLVLLGPASPGYLATPSQMPGAIVEPLFVTDPFEASIANGDAGRQTIAAGIAQAVTTFLPGT